MVGTMAPFFKPKKNWRGAVNYKTGYENGFFIAEHLIKYWALIQKIDLSLPWDVP